MYLQKRAPVYSTQELKFLFHAICRELFQSLFHWIIFTLFLLWLLFSCVWPFQPQGRHAGMPCPSLSPGLCSNSCSLCWWCHQTTSSCHPLCLLPLIFPSIRIFSSESAIHIEWPKYWSFSFSISPSNGYSGLISFRIDWFDLLAVQETLKSLLQHYKFKSISSSALSLLDGPTLIFIHYFWKNHSFDYMDLCRQTDVFTF